MADWSVSEMYIVDLSSKITSYYPAAYPWLFTCSLLYGFVGKLVTIQEIHSFETWEFSTVTADNLHIFHIHNHISEAKHMPSFFVPILSISFLVQTSYIWYAQIEEVYNFIVFVGVRVKNGFY